jgi:hypothetical protein
VRLGQPLRVRWGRDRLYDPTQPSEAILEFLDPDGRWGSDPALFGAPLDITTDLGIMFRGRVDGIVMTPTQITEPNAPIPSDVWAVQITASDVLADLARLTPPGKVDSATPVNAEAASIQYYGAGRWNEYDNTEQRRAAITAAMRKVGIGSLVTTKDLSLTVPPGRTWTQWYREPGLSAGADLLTLIQAVIARGDELTHVRYIVPEDRITWGGFPKTAALELSYTAATIGVTVDAASGARVVPCGLVAIDGAEQVDSSVTHNISSLRVHEYMETAWVDTSGGAGNTYGTWIYQQGSVDTPVAGARGYAQLDSAAMITNNRLHFPAAVATGQTETAADFAARLVPQIATLNGKLQPPILAFDIEANVYGTGNEAALLSTWTVPGAWTFPGSRYDGLTGWGPFFQLIGGELDYRQGWEVLGTFAPAASTGTTLTITQLVTTDPPLLNQYADTISLGTLGLVTKGV